MHYSKFIAILTFITFASISFGQTVQYVQWNDDDVYTHDYTTNTLTKIGANGLSAGVVYSNEYLLAGKSGKISLKVQDPSSGTLIGLDPNNQNRDYKRLAFSVYINQGKIYVLKLGKIVGSYGTLTNKDLLEVVVSKGYPMIYKNGSRVYASTTKFTTKLYLAAGINLTGSTISQAYSSFKRPVSIQDNLIVTNASEFEDNGSITINPKGGTKPYIVLWDDGSSSATQSDLASGSYGLTITDQDQEVFSFTIDLYRPTDFGVVQGFITSDGGTYTKQGAEEDPAFIQSLESIETNSSGKFSMEMTGGVGEFGFALVNIDEGDISNRFHRGVEIRNRQIYISESFNDTTLEPLFAVMSKSTEVKSTDKLVLSKVDRGSHIFDIVLEFKGKSYVIAGPLGGNFNIGAAVDILSPLIRFNRPDIVKATTGQGPQNSVVCPEKMNYSSVKSYDFGGSILENSKSYMNSKGQVIQGQSRWVAGPEVLVQETLYDEFGRPALSTLAAPSYNDALCYDEYFISNQQGDPYSYEDFDNNSVNDVASGGKFNPKSVLDTQKGSLGWYYSDNNNENGYVPADELPFSRVIYSEDHADEVVGYTGVGENFRLGKQRSVRTFKVPSKGELSYVMGMSGPKTYKEVTLDQVSGVSSVTYISSEGRVIASCLSGEENVDNTPTVFHAKLSGKQGDFVNLHKPSQATSIRLNVYRYEDEFDNFNVILKDLQNEKILLKGDEGCASCDFVVSTTSNGDKEIVFANDYASTETVFKLSLQEIPDASIDNYPRIRVAMVLQYSRWTINRYDDQGRLTEVYDPNAVNNDEFVIAEERLLLDDMTEDEVLDLVQRDFILQDNNATYSIYDAASNTFPTGITLQEVTIGAPDQEFIDQSLTVNFTALGEYFDISDLTDQTVIDDNTEIYGETWVENDCGYVEITPTGEFEINPITAHSIIPEQQTFGHNQTPTGNHNVDGFEIQQFIPGGNGSPCDDGHCFNGIQDCDETGVDIGGSCHSPYVCNTPANSLEFRLTVDILVDNQLIDTKVLEPRLLRTCDCRFTWKRDWAEFHLEDETLVSGSTLTLKLRDIRAKGANEDDFRIIDLAHYDHSFGNLIDISTRIYHEYEIIPQELVTPFPITEPVPEPLEETPLPRFVSKKIEYNGLNQIVKIHERDMGYTRFQYDSKRRARFSQTEQQKTGNRFSYVVYDEIGRIAETGIMEHIQNGGVMFEFGNGTEIVPPTMTSSQDYLDTDLPALGKIEVVLYQYDRSDALLNVSEYGELVQKNLIGKVSKVHNDNTTMWYSYTWSGQIDWTLRHIAEDDSYHYMEYYYDQAGKLVSTAYEPQAASESFFHYYEYDTSKRLEKVLTGREPGKENATQNATYSYDQTGQLTRNELGDNLQGIDYVYMINGNLKSINNPITSRDPGKDGQVGSSNHLFTEDAFGLTLDYYENDYRRKNTGIQSHVTLASNSTEAINNDYDNTIKSVRWKTNNTVLPNDIADLPFGADQLMYKYKYDKIGQLTTATFGTITTDGTQNTNGNADRFKSPEWNRLPDYKVENLTYDLNGNIETLTRLGIESQSLEMDVLSYTYKDDDYGDKSNQLDYVSDGESDTNAYLDDFSTQSSGNYIYDKAGKLTHDKIKDIYFKYNGNDLVSAIYRDIALTSKVIEFTYDENGLKVNKFSYDTNGDAIRKITYIRDAKGTVIRQVEVDLTQTTPSEDGDNYMIYGSNSIGSYDDVVEGNRYHITDHLGNVRMIIADELDASGLIQPISYEDYYPFGSSLKGRSFSSEAASLQEYSTGFQGQEMDKEVGLVNFDLRQYDSQIGRWMSADPYRQHASPYLAMRNNPISFIDPDGGNDVDANCTEGCYDKNVNNPDNETGWNSNHWLLLTAHGYGNLADQLLHQGFSSITAWFRDKTNDGNTTDDRLDGIQFINKDGSSSWINTADSKATFGHYLEMGTIGFTNYITSDGFINETKTLNASFLENEAKALARYELGQVGFDFSEFDFENSSIQDIIQYSMVGVNTAVGAVSTYMVAKGNYHKWNELWHKTKTRGTSWVWQTSKWNNPGARHHRVNQIKSVAGARKIADKLTKAGGALLILDIAASGELKPSHAINAAMLGASTTGVGAIVAGIWFIADFGTMGVNYLISGQAKGIGDMIDESVGTYEMYDGLY